MEIDDTRRYKPYRLKRETDQTETLYCCPDCGAVVGPMLMHRGQHDRWHERMDPLAPRA